MTAPPSIRRFEQLWWAGTLAWAVGTMLSWQRTRLTLAANPQTAAAAEVALPITVAVVLGITALSWWLVAKRGSPIGRWLVVVTAALSGIEALVRLGSVVTGRALYPASLIAFLIGEALTVAAAMMLFRPDTPQWFGLGEPEDLP